MGEGEPADINLAIPKQSMKKATNKKKAKEASLQPEIIGYKMYNILFQKIKLNIGIMLTEIQCCSEELDLDWEPFIQMPFINPMHALVKFC